MGKGLTRTYWMNLNNKEKKMVDAPVAMAVLCRWIDSELQEERKKKLLELGAKIAENKLTGDEQALSDVLRASFGSAGQ